MKKEFGFESYTLKTVREFAKETFENRKAKNASYSLRAFARDLNMNHSSVSEFLRGKRRLSAKKLELIVKQLKLSEQLTKDAMLSSRKNPQGFRVMKALEIRALNQWYSFALAEMPKLKSFSGDLKWISKALGVPTVQIEKTLRILEKMQWIRKDATKGWVVNEDHTSTLGQQELKKVILRNLVKMTDLQKKALLKNDPEQGSMVGITFAINKADLPEARKKIYDFINEMSLFLERKEVEKTNVYRMNISLFPLTQSLE